MATSRFRSLHACAHKALGQPPQKTTTFPAESYSMLRVATCKYEQSTNYISLKNRPRSYVKSSTVQDAFWPIPCTPHQLHWVDLSDGDCYLMHRMQSDGWPYSRGEQRLLKSTIYTYLLSVHKCVHARVHIFSFSITSKRLPILPTASNMQNHPTGRLCYQYCSAWAATTQ